MENDQRASSDGGVAAGLARMTQPTIQDNPEIYCVTGIACVAAGLAPMTQPSGQQWM